MRSHLALWFNSTSHSTDTFRSFTSQLSSILHFFISSFGSPYFSPVTRAYPPLLLFSFCCLLFVYLAFPHCRLEHNGGFLALEGMPSSLNSFRTITNISLTGRILRHCFLRKNSLYAFDKDHRCSSLPRQLPRKLSSRSRHLDTLP